MYHLFYSQQAAKKFGTVVYSTIDGDEKLATVVMQTSMCPTKEDAEKTYLWEDKEYLGLGVKFVRRETEGEWPCREYLEFSDIPNRFYFPLNIYR
jgi:hypothetical protein